MKRNEFKLLLEDWKRNFIVESPENPYGVQQTLGQDDLNFASDYDEYDEMDQDSDTMDNMSMPGDFSDLDSDDMALARGDHSDYSDSADDSLGYGGHSLSSSDSEEDIDGFSGMYDDDPTYTAGDYSSMGGEDIDDLLPRADDSVLPENYLMDKDDDAGF